LASFLIGAIHVPPLMALFAGANLADWMCFVVQYGLLAFCLAAGLHRYFAHGAFRTSRSFQFAMGLIATTTYVDPIGFTGSRRIHHRGAPPYTGTRAHAARTAPSIGSPRPTRPERRLSGREDTLRRRWWASGRRLRTSTTDRCRRSMGLILARTLGADAGWTVIVAAASTASMAVNAWEQAQTGIFQLGRIQQVEFALVLSVLMVASAWLGTDYWAGIVVGPVTLQAVLLACVSLAVFSGMVQNVLRVRKTAAPWLAVSGYLLLVAALTALGARGDLPAIVAVLLVTLVSGAFGARMLLHRVRRELARIGVSYDVWATLLCLALAVGASRWTALLGGLVGAFYAAAAFRAAWALRATAGAADLSPAKTAVASVADAAQPM
jgi:hypothetical protein